MPDDNNDPLGPDDIGIFAFFFEGEGNPQDLEGIDDAQLRLIQNDLCDRLKAQDEARERAIREWLHEFEQKYYFANSLFLENSAKVSALLDPDRPGMSRVKSADKMVMMPTVFDGDHLRKQNNIMKDLISVSCFKSRMAI